MLYRLIKKLSTEYFEEIADSLFDMIHMKFSIDKQDMFYIILGSCFVNFVLNKDEKKLLKNLNILFNALTNKITKLTKKILVIYS